MNEDLSENVLSLSHSISLSSLETELTYPLIPIPWTNSMVPRDSMPPLSSPRLLRYLMVQQSVFTEVSISDLSGRISIDF